MRKVDYSLTNSLDNFIARADGAYDWILMDDEIMSEFPKLYASFDTVLIDTPASRATSMIWR